MVCLFGFKKKNNRIHSNTMLTFFHRRTYCYDVSLQKPTNRKKLHGRWRTAWVLPFKLWINYNTVASFKKRKKETLAFICTKASCKALFRSLSWNVSSAGFLKKHLSADLITQMALGVRAVLRVSCVIFRLGSECELVSQTISILGLKRSFKWHFARSYLSLDCSDTALLEACPSCLNRACATHPPLYYIGFKAFFVLKVSDCFLPAEEEQDQMLGCCVLMRRSCLC